MFVVGLKKRVENLLWGKGLKP